MIIPYPVMPCCPCPASHGAHYLPLSWDPADRDDCSLRIEIRSEYGAPCDMDGRARLLTQVDLHTSRPTCLATKASRLVLTFLVTRWLSLLVFWQIINDDTEYFDRWVSVDHKIISALLRPLMISKTGERTDSCSLRNDRDEIKGRDQKMRASHVPGWHALPPALVSWSISDYDWSYGWCRDTTTPKLEPVSLGLPYTCFLRSCPWGRQCRSFAFDFHLPHSRDSGRSYKSRPSILQLWEFKAHPYNYKRRRLFWLAIWESHIRIELIAYNVFNCTWT